MIRHFSIDIDDKINVCLYIYKIECLLIKKMCPLYTFYDWHSLSFSRTFSIYDQKNASCTEKLCSVMRRRVMFLIPIKRKVLTKKSQFYYSCNDFHCCSSYAVEGESGGVIILFNRAHPQDDVDLVIWTIDWGTGILNN